MTRSSPRSRPCAPSGTPGKRNRQTSGEGYPRHQRSRLRAGLGRITLQAASSRDCWRHRLYSSPALLTELAEVLARPHLGSRLHEKRSSVEQALALYGELVIEVSPPEVPRVVPRDADDDQVVAAALAARADLIVTGDADLLSLGSFGTISIVTPAQAVLRIGG